MAYGLKVTGGANNDIIISDSEINMSNLVAVAAGTGSTITPTWDAVLPTQPQQLYIFFRVNPTGNRVVYPIATATGIAFGVPTAGERLGYNFITSSITYTPIVVEYIVMVPASTQTSSGGYGLRVNTVGGSVQFDDKVLTANNSIEFTNTYLPGATGNTLATSVALRSEASTTWFCVAGALSRFTPAFTQFNSHALIGRGIYYNSSYIYGFGHRSFWAADQTIGPRYDIIGGETLIIKGDRI